jgi:mRNA interferase MazF
MKKLETLSPNYLLMLREALKYTLELDSFENENTEE